MNGKIAHAPYAELIMHMSMIDKPLNYGLLRSYCVTRKEFAQAVELANSMGVRVKGLSSRELHELRSL